MPGKSNKYPKPGGRRYVKIEEAAAYIDVNPATIRVMLADGRLTPYKLGDRIWRVDLKRNRRRDGAQIKAGERSQNEYGARTDSCPPTPC